ncbi:MAG: SseB family protein [Amaricoccus sp.]|uniref:SseB family protein n=1 Tax=Amaricoccus sp. TaxID=1872485 RepID=UPI0039E666D8
MQTPLDLAHAAHEAAPEDAALRLRFHERILDTELIVPLAAPPEDERIEPQIFGLSDGPVVLAFDRDDRMAEFLGAPADFAALTGRRLVALLAGHGTGLALNLGAPSAALLPPEAVDWLARIAAEAVPEASARASDIGPPGIVPRPLLDALGPKLAAMADRLASAHLVSARLGDGPPALLLALVGVPVAARPAMAAAVAEAVRFSGLDDAALDVTFPDAGSALAAAVAREGLRFEMPAPVEEPAPVRENRPPRLR